MHAPRKNDMGRSENEEAWTDVSWEMAVLTLILRLLDIHN